MFLVYKASPEDIKNAELNYTLIEQLNDYWSKRGFAANARICPMTGTITSDIRADWKD